MKILILANFDVGLYQFRSDLIKALLKKHEVVLSLPDGELVRPLEEMGCRFFDTPIDRRGINPVKDFRLLWRYLRLLRKQKPDLVITYTIKPNIYGGIACRLHRIPYGVNITGLGTVFQGKGLLRRIIPVFYRFALKKAKVVFFENADNMNTMVAERIVPPAQCCLLNGAGVNLDRYTYTPYPNGGPVHFLFVGRVMKEKGVEELFSAMKRLRDEGTDCHLDMLGAYEENYAQVIQEYENQGWLHYHGFVKDVRPFIEKAHCFVLPSYHEGMANTNLECAAMGRPLITSNIPGCREAVVEGVSGLLCCPENADSLYVAMKAFVQLPAEQRESMGRAGRAHMEAVFDKKIVVAETMKALKLA